MTQTSSQPAAASTKNDGKFEQAVKTNDGTGAGGTGIELHNKDTFEVADDLLG